MNRKNVIADYNVRQTGSIIVSRSSIGAEMPIMDYEETIHKYMGLLEEDPENCFFTEQSARNFQALNNLQQAITFYENALHRCSDNLSNNFQLGVCYYLIMDRDLGIEYMDNAIEGARMVGDNKMADMFNEEKKFWLEKWDLVKEMEWNRSKSQ